MRSLRILIGAALLSALAAGCGGGGSDPLPGNNSQLHPEDLVPDVTVQVVDHRFRNAQLSGDNLDPDPIFSLIASASASLDIALPSINRQAVGEALLAEAASGTRIRIITEKAFYDNNAFKPFYDQLEDVTRNRGNLEIRTDLEGLPRQMHARFMVIDQARVITGSYNWESESSDRTFGDVISILNTNVAAAFTTEFNQMFVEGNFGTQKRNATQHSFLVGGGNGLLEVYFGPTDLPQDLIETEIGQSDFVFFAVQQFKDFRLATFLLNHILGSANSRVIGIINDNFANSDAEEQAVYNAFLNYTQSAEDEVVGTLSINLPAGSIDRSGRDLNQWPQTLGANEFSLYNTMNHKLMFVDHSRSDNVPAVIFSTANYSNIGLTQNDEVFLIFRRAPLVNRFVRGMGLGSGVPPESLVNAGDVQEINQLMVMWPFVSSAQVATGDDFRDFAGTSSAIIFGEVSNFKPVITQLDSDGEEVKIPIDVNFAIRGRTFFGNLAFGGDARKVFDPNETPDGAEEPKIIFPDLADPFNNSELINPDFRYLLVVPAGEITVSTVVLEDDSPSDRFTVQEKTFFIGPGAVRRIDMQIGQLVEQDGGGGGTGV